VIYQHDELAPRVLAHLACTAEALAQSPDARGESLMPWNTLPVFERLDGWAIDHDGKILVVLISKQKAIDAAVSHAD
jgi:hypothetical protein